MRKIFRRWMFLYRLHGIRETEKQRCSLEVLEEYLEVILDYPEFMFDPEKMKGRVVTSRIASAHAILLLLEQALESLERDSLVKYNYRLISDRPGDSSVMDWYYKSIRAGKLSPEEYFTRIDKLVQRIEKEAGKQDVPFSQYVNRQLTPIVENFKILMNVIYNTI